MIGRELELLELGQLVETTLSGKGSYTLIKGAKGMGKKTLVKTVLDEGLDKNNPITLVEVKSKGSMIPFLSFDEAFKTINTSVSLENILDSKNIPKDALVLTQNPEIYKQRGFNNVVWLSAIKNDLGTLTISPERIEFELTRMMKQNPDAYIIFDGLEMFMPYLKDVDRIKKFVDEIKRRNNYIIFASKDALGEYYSDFENAVTRIDPSDIDETNHLYLIEEKNPNAVIEKHKSLVSSNKKGFFVTMQPKRIIEEMGLGSCAFISDSSDGDYDPTRLDFEILKKIQRFMDENKNNGVVTITDLEGLINHKSLGFEKVYKVINYLKDTALINGIDLVIQFNSDVFLSKENKKHIPAFFERQFGTLKNHTYDSLNLNSISTNYGRDRAINEALTILSTKTPAIVYVEHADKLDDQSKLLLEHLVKTSGNGLSVIATSESSDLDELFSENIIELGNLKPESSLELIKSLLEEKSLPIENNIITQIQNITQGNPQYISEIIEQYKQDGKLKTPHSLEELLTDKLSKLSDRETILLSYAAVLGIFNTKVLTYMNNPTMVENLTNVQGIPFSCSEEETIRFLDKMENVGFINKSNDKNYSIDELVKEIIMSKTSDGLKQILYSRAYLVFENSKIPNRYGAESQLRTLEYLSKLDYNEDIVNKLISKIEVLTTVQDTGKEIIFPAAKIGVSAFNKLAESAESGKMDESGLIIKKEGINLALDVYNVLREMYLADGQINNAVKTAEESLNFFSQFKNPEIMKKEDKIHYSLAETLLIKGELDRAEKIYKQLLHSQDKEIKFQSQISLSKINMARGEKDVSAQYLENAKKELVREDVKQVITTYCLGLNYILDNRTDLAFKEFEKEVFNQKSMNSSENARFKNYYLINFAVLQGMLGEKTSALTNLNIVLERSRNQPENEVYALVNLGILSQDITYIKKAKEKAQRYDLVEKDKLTDIPNVIGNGFWFVYK